MNCQEAQDAILLAEKPAELASNAELTVHLSACAGCRALLERVERLESAAINLDAPGSEDGKLIMLRRIRSMNIRPGRRFVLRPMFLSSMAALLVIGIGLGAYFYNIDRQTPTSVVDRLIDWDLELADAQASTQRQAIFTSQATALESEVRGAALSDDDRQLATTLLEHGTWLCVNSDPIEQAEKFSDLSDLILARMHKAAAADDAKTMQRLERRYDLVIRRGIGGNLARLNASASISPENARKLERIAKRNAEHERKLQLMADRSSKALERDVKRALETSKKQARNFKGAGARTF